MVATIGGENMITWSKIDRRDIPAINVAIDWSDNRQLYLSSVDLAPVLEMNVEDVIELSKEGSFVDTYGITYLKSQAILSMLEELNTTLCKQVHYWISADILPSIQAMPYATALKL